jgi:RNA polymerase-binding protein DksA
MDQQKLEYFTRRLLAEYDRIQRELGHYEQEITELNSPTVQEYEEKSSLEEQKEFLTGLLQHDADELVAVRDALRKVLEGTYGICERCGKPIEEERLEAIPTCRYCKSCKEELEKERLA